jgi:adenylosuccinate synthase
MAVVVVVGAQWGDEGKGKVVDLLTEKADVVVRFGGGANAGHTLVIGDRQLITHLIPSGVLHPGKRCVLGDGMVIDPQTLLEEIDACKQQGLLAGDELLIGERAHVILPYHRQVEALREQGSRAIGTTRRGIGPAYEAKVGRRGVRMRDLLRPERLRALVRENLDELGAVIRHYGGEPPGAAEVEAIVSEALRAGELLAPHFGDAGRFVDRSISEGRDVLFEGAQGALLDIDHGTYPFVTSSSTIAGGACQGLGIGPTRIDRVVGITKAYATRVGGGPFPTQMDDDDEAAWREAGAEFGATTGRPRRCGWLDVPALRLAIRINGISSLALTKLDVARGRGPVRLCVAYELDGQELDELPLDPEDLERAIPRFLTLPGWEEETASARSLDELPAAAREYIDTLERLTGVPFALISIGPERNQTVSLTDPFADA